MSDGVKTRTKLRADELLLKLALVETRSKAQSFIMQGWVEFRSSVSKDSVWRKVEKAGLALVESETELRLTDDALPKDVGRGAQKLRGAISHWKSIPLRGLRGLDIGSSTGGFTQVLLENGVREVVAMDVGTHQLHERLRNDPRVIVCDQTHVLKVDADFWKEKKIEPAFEIIVTDVSFISLTKIISHAAAWLKAGGSWILLIKPQFEVGPQKAPQGIVREEKHRQEAVTMIRNVVEETKRLRWKDMIQSPLKGADGNVEFLAWIEKLD
jgi:23S rRNA (cytidine1920-2'-O)/16S rRNA (cytidine1409-2'-O)-methyltransferase